MKRKLSLPQFAVLSLGILLLCLFAIRQANLPMAHASAPVEWQVALRFVDGPEGEVVVLDASNQKEITRFEGEQGFLRGTLRAMARERKRRDIDSGPSCALMAHPQGRMTLKDNATGQTIDLASFGPSNLAVFQHIKAVTEKN